MDKTELEARIKIVSGRLESLIELYRHRKEARMANYIQEDILDPLTGGGKWANAGE